MFKKALFVSLFVVSFTSGFFTISENDNAEGGAPGATQIFLNVDAMNTLLKLITGFTPYYALVGKSWTGDFEVNLAGIDFKLTNVTISGMNIGESSMAFVNGTDTVRTTIKDTYLNLTVEAKATSKVPIPLKISEVSIQNFTLQLDLATTSDDQLIWQVQEGIILSLDNLTLTCEEKFWQKIINDDIQPAAMKAITYGLNVFEGVIHGAIDVFNEILENEGPNTFNLNIQNLLGAEEEMPLNLTMSKAPEFSRVKNEILLHIDSNFVSDEMRTYVPENTIWENYTDVTQKEQLWIHQSMINTALYDLEKRLSGDGV